MLHMSLEVLPKIEKDEITMLDIYEEYVKIFRNREILILSKNKTD